MQGLHYRMVNRASSIKMLVFHQKKDKAELGGELQGA
jgi:hypothetical protein